MMQLGLPAAIQPVRAALMVRKVPAAPVPSTVRIRLASCGLINQARRDRGPRRGRRWKP